ncbi:flippase [Enterovirga aerilata]|uniref:Flippase n=1 Tax=Enterovirga aerilata TaxID=2730920 RepID=A0A849I1Q9_9HYPH|nr:flippase [Enterovirga sp. DB1703]NNM71278.1 flippase [Enterovirga sp. DB1703]
MRKPGIARSFAANSIGTLLTLLVSILTVPIYVHQVGDARYGVLSIVWLLLGYFGFLDLGLSRASTNALAKIGEGSDEERTRVFATSLAINLVLGAVGSFVLYVCGSFLLERIVSVPAELRPEVEASLPWVASLLPLALVSGVAVGTLEARERFVAANVLQVAGTSIGQIAPVICAIVISPSLTVVIPAAVIARAFGVLLVLGYVVLRNGPWTGFRVDPAKGRALLGYGGWVTVSSVVSPILQSVDQFVIGSILGVAAVTYYAIPMNLVVRSQLFAVALSRSLFPRMSRLDPEEGRRISSRSLVTLAFGYAAISAPAIVFVEPFLGLWIGPTFADTAGSLARVLFLGGWLNGLAFIPFSLLQAQGRPDITAKFHLVEMLPFLAVLWVLSSHFGLLGAAIAWSLRTIVDGGLLFAAARLEYRALLSILPAGLTLVFALALAELVPLSLLPAFLAASAVGVGVLGLGLACDAELRSRIERIASDARLFRTKRSG